MAERASMPLFVPRTVATFERAAMQVARRVAPPLRAVATRAMTFADRVLGAWAGPSTTVGGFTAVGERPAMRAAQRSGGLVMPKPWYESAADEDAIAVAPAGVRRDPTPTGVRLAPAAERGAAIARTALTAPPAVATTRATDTTTRATDTTTRATDTTTRAIDTTTRAPETRATETRAAETPAPATPTRASESRKTDAPVETRHQPAASPTSESAAPAADVRAAEALGLHVAPPPSTAAMTTTPRQRPATPLARALAHTAWVDEQLRAVMAPVAPVLERATSSWVFVAPADVERAPVEPSGMASRTSAAPVVSRPTPVAPMTVAPAIPQAMSPPVIARPATVAAVSPAWSASLPDQRVSTAWPARIAQGVAEFVARLVGVQTARDTSPVAVAESATELPAAAISVRAPARAFVAPLDRPAPSTLAASVAPATVAARMAATAPVSWRPGAAAARVESLGTAVDARVGAAWGEPAATARVVPGVERTFVAPTAEPATGPARSARFMDRLVGVQAIRAATPLPLPAIVAARSTDVAPAATSEPRPVASMALTPGAIGLRAERMGAIVGVRAASLSIDFVDPARLSLLTGAAPSMPTVTAPSVEPQAAQRTETEASARETIMPPPRPLFAMTPPLVGSRGLSAEEWSLMATFPSMATAVQMVAARQSAHWQAVESQARASAAGPRTLVTVGADGPRVVDAATGAPSVGPRVARPTQESTLRVPSLTEAPATSARPSRTVEASARVAPPMSYVAPSLGQSAPTTQTQLRLPDGRSPRGSFTWPKLADYAPAEWIAPASVTSAEHAKQAPPGTPLWGALPPLVSIAPQLATAANATGESPTGAPPSARAVSSARPDARTPSTTSSPALTLMTAVAAREARAAQDSSREQDGASLPSLTMTPGMARTPGTIDATRVGGPSPSGRGAPSMPLMTAPPTGGNGAQTRTGPSARALELARPFLRMIEGGIASDSGRPTNPRFFDQPQPLVSAVPSSDSASRIVEAVRSQPAATPSDDRVTLADLTLIAMASAEQKVAASPAGGGPSAGAPAAAAPSAAADAGHGGGGKSGNPAQEIEELARAAFAELQRLVEIARERSGDHG